MKWKIIFILFVAVLLISCVNKNVEKKQMLTKENNTEKKTELTKKDLEDLREDIEAIQPEDLTSFNEE